MENKKEILIVKSFDDVPWKWSFAFGKYKSISQAKYIVRRINSLLKLKACIWDWTEYNLKYKRKDKKHFHILIEGTNIQS